jgi:capsular exopolysaccharide synthesis family protein
MSRVSDALERAAEAKAQLSSRALQSQQRHRIEKNSTETVTKNDNGSSPQVSLLESHLAARTWRERIEEILFGWDLRRLKTHPLVALEKDSPAAEQYKILREQLKTLWAETGSPSIAVTSPVKHEGKTMVAVNLAVALALGSEENVLLIDGDLRNPEMHRYFAVGSEPGLSDYLTSSSNGNGNLSSYVRPTLLPGLQILPSGRHSELAPELLAKERMSRLLKEIRAAFPQGHVIIDTPPVLATSDPLVLAREVAGVIMVVRAGRTRREFVKKAVDTLNSPKLLGIVLNGTQQDISYKHYRYSGAKSNS